MLVQNAESATCEIRLSGGLSVGAGLWRGCGPDRVGGPAGGLGERILRGVWLWVVGLPGRGRGSVAYATFSPGPRRSGCCIQYAGNVVQYTGLVRSVSGVRIGPAFLAVVAGLGCPGLSGLVLVTRWRVGLPVACDDPSGVVRMSRRSLTGQPAVPPVGRS